MFPEGFSKKNVWGLSVQDFFTGRMTFLSIQPTVPAHWRDHHRHLLLVLN